MNQDPKYQDELSPADSMSELSDDPGQLYSDAALNYRRMAAKYANTMKVQSYSQALGHYLLRNSKEGVAMFQAGRLCSANSSFYSLCSGPEHFSRAGDLHPQDAPGLLELASTLVREFDAEPAQAQRLTLHGDRGRLLEATLERMDVPLGATMFALRDVTVQDSLERERCESVQRDEFITVLAHELRNPLSVMLNAAEVILGSADEHEIRVAAEIIRRQAKHQAQLVGEIFDKARVRQGKLTLRPTLCDLREILRDAADATELQRSHGVSLEIDLPQQPVLLLVDRTRILQCVTNLLINAAKFTPPGGQNRLALKARKMVWIRVIDTGIGLAPDMLPRVFELHSQADHSLVRSGNGLGLGLTLTKRLIEMHGGGVRVASEGPGRGAEFTIFLPMVSGALHQALRRDSSISPGPRRGSARPDGERVRRRILVVEQNDDARPLLVLSLQAMGHTVFAAKDGQEGLATAQRERPDIIVTDLALAGCLAMATELRREVPDAQLIGLAGGVDCELKQHAIQAGFSCCLAKTLGADHLIQTISDLPLPNQTR